MKISVLKAQASAFLDQYKQKEPAAYAAAQQAIGGVLILDGLVGLQNPLNSRKSRPGIFGSLGGVILGIIFMFIPLIFGGLTGINNLTGQTTGTVTHVVTHTDTSTNSNGATSTTTDCTLTATYTVKSQSYTQQETSSSSADCGYAAGSSVTVYYNPQNPAAWIRDKQSVSLILTIFFWVGLVVAILSIIRFVIRLLSIIFGWKLLKSGRALAATLPAGTNLGTMIDEIKKNFTGSLFNFGGVQGVLSQVIEHAENPAGPSETPPPTTPPVPPAPPAL